MNRSLVRSETNAGETGKAYLGPFIFLQSCMILFALWRALKVPLWAQYDWEINYSAGFIRRGLYGEILRRLHLLSHTYLLFTSTVIVSYAVFFLCVWRLSRRTQWSIPITLLVYSPAALGFTLLSPARIGNKEVLFLVLIALSAAIPLRVWYYLPGLLIASFLVVLTHEVAAFYLPYIFAVLWIRTGKNWKRATLLFSGPLLLTIAAFALASTHPGNTFQAQAICRSVGGTSLESPPCDGPIHYLTNSREQAHEETVAAAHYWHFGVQIPYLLLLALLPIALLLRSLFNSDVPTARKGLGFLFLAWGATLPLFWFATDWDRWIYVHISSAMILSLLYFQKNEGLGYV